MNSEEYMNNTDNPEVLAAAAALEPVCRIGVPANLGAFRIEKRMAQQDTDGMINISGRWWSFPGAQIETDSWEVECRGYGKLYLLDGAGNVVEGTEVDNPEVLAGLPLPTPEEQRRREVMLARVMLVAIDIVLAGDSLGLETARDLMRELRHTYPEVVDEYL